MTSIMAERIPHSGLAAINTARHKFFAQGTEHCDPSHHLGVFAQFWGEHDLDRAISRDR